MTGAPVFVTNRTDGRSDRAVVYDLVKDASPDTVFTFQQIADALAVGYDGEVTLAKVRSAVQQARRTLLAQQRRYLVKVTGVGVRVGRAEEHMGLALAKRDSASAMMERGVDILRSVEWDELDPTQRKLHEGQLMIMSGLTQALRRSEARQAKHDKLIADLTARVARIESA